MELGSTRAYELVMLLLRIALQSRQFTKKLIIHFD